MRHAMTCIGIGAAALAYASGSIAADDPDDAPFRCIAPQTIDGARPCHRSAQPDLWQHDGATYPGSSGDGPGLSLQPRRQGRYRLRRTAAAELAQQRQRVTVRRRLLASAALNRGHPAPDRLTGALAPTVGPRFDGCCTAGGLLTFTSREGDLPSSRC